MATCGGCHQQLWPAYIGGWVGGIQESIQTPFDDYENYDMWWSPCFCCYKHGPHHMWWTPSTRVGCIYKRVGGIQESIHEAFDYEQNYGDHVHLLICAISQSAQRCWPFDVEICPTKKPILAGGTFTAVGLCGLFSFASDKPGQAKSNQCISKLMHRGNVPEGRIKEKVLLG